MADEEKAAVKRLIAETEAELQWARGARDATPGPRKFLEFDALIAAVRLRALREAVTAFEGDRQ